MLSVSCLLACLFMSIDRASLRLRHRFRRFFSHLNHRFTTHRATAQRGNRRRLYIDFMQARRAIPALSLFFNHLRKSGPALFLHARLIRSNKTFVKPARRLSRKIISRHYSRCSGSREIGLPCSRRNSPSPLCSAFPPPRSARPDSQLAQAIIARRHSKDCAAVRLRESQP